MGHHFGFCRTAMRAGDDAFAGGMGVYHERLLSLWRIAPFALLLDAEHPFERIGNLYPGSVKRQLNLRVFLQAGARQK